MPRRETQLKGSLNKWEGVNQRVQPTLVPDGFFFFAKGVHFGLNSNVERLEGKVLKDKIPAPVYSLTPWGNFVIVQIEDSLLMYDSVGNSIDSPAFGLYAFYKLKTDVLDSSGNGRTLTNNGGVTLTGTDASFAGAGLLTATNFLSTPTDFSIGFWLNMGSAPGANCRWISKGNNTAGTGFHIYCNNGTNPWYPIFYTFPFAGYAEVTTNVNGSVWRFIKARYTQATNKLELGINNGAMVVATGSAISDWTQNFTIGGIDLPFTGLIKDVSVYDSLVSDNIFTQLYNGGTPWEPA